MHNPKRTLLLPALLALLLTLGSCRSHRSIAPRADNRSDNSIASRAEIRAAGEALGLRIEPSDFLPLYLEAATWIGTPHRLGGLAKQRGADCSGMSMSIYRDVYGKQLERSSAAMCATNCRPLKSRKELREGDLVFFKFEAGGPVSHVGIYLKDGCFIHVSSKRGARVDRLDHPYYLRTFYCGGRVK